MYLLNVFSYHLHQQLFLAAINALADTALLRSVFITRFAITNGDFTFLGR